MSTATIQPKAEAIAGIDDAVVGAGLGVIALGLCITLLVSAGIKWATYGDAKEACNQFLKDVSSAKSFIVSQLPHIENGVWTLPKSSAAALKKFFAAAKAYFSGGSVKVISTHTYSTDDAKIVMADTYSNLISNADYDTLNSLASFDVTNGGTVTLTGADNISYVFIVSVISSTLYLKYKIYREDPVEGYYSLTASGLAGTLDLPNDEQAVVDSVKLGFYEYTSGSDDYGSFIIANPYLVSYVEYIGWDYQSFYPAGQTSANKIYKDYYNPTTTIYKNDYAGATSIYTASEGWSSVVEGKETDTVVDVSDVVEGLQSADADDQLALTQTAVQELVGVREAVEEIAANQSLSDTEEDLDIPNLPTSLADKFPFCVPFDLVHLIGALNATAVDPVWTIPFVIPSLGINESFTFDLTQFETVAQVIRVFVVLFFILGLILITRKIIQA